MKTQNIKISKIKPYSNNAKTHPPEQIKKIAASIKEFGFQQPLVVDENNEVVIGHGRLMAATQLKMKELPCVVVTHLSDEQKKAFRIADNKVSESDYDTEKLMFEFIELRDMEYDLDITGFEELEIDYLTKEELLTISEAEDFDIIPKPEPKWILICTDDEESILIQQSLNKLELSNTRIEITGDYTNANR